MDTPLRIVCSLLLALSLMTACSASSKAGFCSIAKPIRLTGQTIAVMTDAEVAAVLAHNQKLQKLCGVKP